MRVKSQQGRCLKRCDALASGPGRLQCRFWGSEKEYSQEGNSESPMKCDSSNLSEVGDVSQSHQLPQLLCPLAVLAVLSFFSWNGGKGN